MVYNNRHDRLRDEIEAIIDKKIQAAFQGIGQKLDEMRNLMAIPAPAADKSLENIMEFIENHVVFTGNHYDHVKQCNVWALFKDVTSDHGKMEDFITRFCTIYGQDREFKVKNIRAFSGFRLKDTRGVCGDGWD